MYDLIVVMPVYNERDALEETLGEWLTEFRSHGIKFKLLALEDGSTDNTAEILNRIASRNPEIEVVSKENSGHGSTCAYGYELALACNAPWVLQLDSDGQCDPKYFKQFWSLKREGVCVQGFRETREDGLMRLLGSRFLSLMVLVKSGKYVADLNVPYRLMDRESLKQVLPMVSRQIDMAQVILSYAYATQFQIVWVPINFKRRRTYRPEMPMSRAIEILTKFYYEFRR